MIRARGVRPSVGADLPRCRSPSARRRRRCPRSCRRGGRGRSARPSGTSPAPRRRSPRRSPMPANDGLSPARPSTDGVGADQLVVVEDGQAVAVRDRDDRAGEVAVGPGLGGAVVGLGGVGVDVVRGSSPRGWRSGRRRCPAARSRSCSAVAGSIAQAPPSEPIGTRLIDSTPPARIRSSKPRAHARGGLVDGLEAGGAEAVELHAGDGLGVAGRERGGLGDVAALVADRRDHAEHDVVDAVRGRGAGLRVLTSSSRPTTRSTGFTSCSEPTALPLPRGVRRWS